MNKYKILRGPEHTMQFAGHPVYRIRALKNFDAYAQGEYGGYVSGEHNLSQYAHCWVVADAIAADRSRVEDNALVTRNARVFGSAWIQDSALVTDNAVACGHSVVRNSAVLSGAAAMGDRTMVCDFAHILGLASIFGTDVFGACAHIEVSPLAGEYYEEV